MAKLVSKTYGDAYVSLVIEQDMVAQAKEEVLALQQIFQDDEDLNKMLHHPKIVKEEKMQILERVFKGRICDDMLGFLMIILKKGRYQEIDGIFQYILDQLKKHEGIGVLEVTSAVELTEKQKEDILARMLDLTDYKSFEIHYQVDASLIGGMILRMKDRVVDNSIQTKLSSMAKKLSQIQL